MSQKENRRGQTGGSEREFGAAGAAILCFQNTTKNGKCQPVYSSAGRCVGRIEGGVYHKRLDPTRHKLDRPPGWAIDRDHLDLPWESIVIETTTGETWRATKDAFLTFGVRIDRGYGDQICLPDRFWRVERRGAPRQLELFRN